MTRFAPEKNNLTPQQWSEQAIRKLQENNDQYSLFACLGVATCVSAAASPISGLLVAGWAFSHHMRKGKKRQDNINAIIDTGCIAHTLSGVDFKRYLNQVGDDAILAELEYAHDHKLEFSDDALNYFEDSCEALQVFPQVAIRSEFGNGSSVLQQLKSAMGLSKSTTTVVDRYEPMANAKIDIINEMSDRVNNTIVIGIPGSGKGMLISNALRAVKQKHQNLKVFVIDPKNDIKEAGYFEGCDVVKSFACMDAKPGTVAAWAESAFDEYAQYATKHDRTLLIVDEGTMLGNKLQQAKSTLLVDKLTSYTSGGDSAGRNVWFMMQSPYVTGASLNLSTTSQMTSIVIAFSENIGAIAQWKSAKIFKQLSHSEVSELIENSTTGRAFYYGKTGKWYMMPELENYSGYDRDKREFLLQFETQSNITKKDAVEKLSDIFHFSTDNENIISPQMSELAKRILSFFDNAKNKEPKKLSDIKKKDELREHGDMKLIHALAELVSSKYLIFDGEDSWLKPDW